MRKKDIKTLKVTTPVDAVQKNNPLVDGSYLKNGISVGLILNSHGLWKGLLTQVYLK